MTKKNVWLITGAGRGLGVDIARAALAAGHAVVATGRDAAKVEAAVGRHENMLPVTLDVTQPQDARAAVEAALAKFERIDVLVNNAGNFFAGFFEELSSEQVRNQIETLLFGPMNVTRAVLPVMRRQRSGLLLTISSTAGIAGQLFCTAYAAAKFGIEGWMESLTPEIAPHLAAHPNDLAGFFGAITSGIAVDVGVMERSKRVIVLPGDFGWDDVGTWAALRRVRVRDANGNASSGDVHVLDATNNVVHADGSAVVLYGVQDLVVVSRDGLTLVTTTDRAADLKKLIESLPPRIREQA